MQHPQIRRHVITLNNTKPYTKQQPTVLSKSSLTCWYLLLNLPFSSLVLKDQAVIDWLIDWFAFYFTQVATKGKDYSDTCYEVYQNAIQAHTAYIMHTQRLGWPTYMFNSELRRSISSLSLSWRLRRALVVDFSSAKLSCTWTEEKKKRFHVPFFTICTFQIKMEIDAFFIKVAKVLKWFINIVI